MKSTCKGESFFKTWAITILPSRISTSQSFLSQLLNRTFTEEFQSIGLKTTSTLKTTSEKLSNFQMAKLMEGFKTALVYAAML